MRESISSTLQRILVDTQKEIEQDKQGHSPKRIRQLARTAPPVRSFYQALASERGLIGEIKERSPSQGRMLMRNVGEAVEAYRQSKLVKAVSVLTSRTHFGEQMTVGRMERIKEQVGKPVLRKDFIVDPYQVYQARAHGADAILLMANILEREEMIRLSGLAFELGMDVLFETHGPEELEQLPESARIIGINCRSFNGGASSFRLARFFRQWGLSSRDRSISASRFDYVNQLPNGVIKVAESGVTLDNCVEVFEKGFHAILVGTSLLMDKRGVAAALAEFEARVLPQAKPAAVRPPLETAIV